MTTPDNGSPAPIRAPASVTVTPVTANNATGPAGKPEAPQAMENTTVTMPKPKVPRFDPKKSFQSTKSVDRLKEYLKKIPVYDAQLKTILADLNQALAEATAAKERFERVTAEIEATVKQWDEERKHGGSEESPTRGTTGA